jgi:hypothetical protein
MTMVGVAGPLDSMYLVADLPFADPAKYSIHA